MPLSFHPSAEQLQEQRKAQRLLERMTRLEGTAEESERATCLAVQAAFAASYRRVIGIDPSQRSELRDALARVANGGGMPVQDVLDVLNGVVR